jgi:hypothetical protein
MDESQFNENVKKAVRIAVALVEGDAAVVKASRLRATPDLVSSPKRSI